MAIVAYDVAHEAAVGAFNERIRAGGSPFRLPRAALPKRDGCATSLEGFLAVDGEAVRGGYVIKHQPFWLGGEMKNVDNLQLPLSEGSVDAKYNAVGIQIMIHAQRHHPLLYALGMGGLGNPLPTMLKSMGWKLCLVPFYFRVIRPAGFLRNIRYARTTRARRVVADVVAATRLGSLVLPPLHVALSRPSLARFTDALQELDTFGAWADELWERARPDYALVALRNAPELNQLYREPRFLKLQVSRRGETLGWAVLLDTRMAEHKQFGSMRLGSVVDCLALPDQERAVVGAATRLLARRGVDLILSNQLHHAWGTAFRQSGYLSGPSNYAFAASKKLAAALDPFDASIARVHMTRGDGDGPIHL